MKLPPEFLQSLKGVPGFEKDAFVAVHEKEESVTSIRVNPSKWTPASESLTGPAVTGERTVIPWTAFGFYLQQRPSFTFDPLFHAGCYYVQEASSMFIEQAVKQLADLSLPLKVLDLCAAPGGKSTHLQSLLSPESLLVSNETIKQRSLVLTDNIIKWGGSNVIVTNNDPKAFQKLPGFFDVLVVDAPCSGSGLFRKDKEAITEWSLNNVALCSQRQQRILADALPSLNENGLLVYSTCSYSPEEDEKIADWLVEEMGMENVKLTTEAYPEIVTTVSEKTGSAGYRFYPDKVKGEGFFLSCFRKKENTAAARLRTGKPDTVAAREKNILQQWMKDDNSELLYFRNTIIALPQHLLPDFMVLKDLLNVQYAGAFTGEILKEKLVPHHAFAQSLCLSPTAPSVDVNYEDAIRYLQRQDISFVPEKAGWQVTRYQGKALGWINALKNRVNNYYPKEIRILKQNNTPFAK